MSAPQQQLDMLASAELQFTGRLVADAQARPAANGQPAHVLLQLQLDNASANSCLAEVPCSDPTKAGTEALAKQFRAGARIRLVVRTSDIELITRNARAHLEDV